MRDVEQLLDLVRDEKKKSEDDQKRLSALASDNKKLAAENEQLQKEVSRHKKTISQVHLERNKLSEQITAAGGALNPKVREKLIRDALKDHLSSAQLDRILLGKRSRWSKEDLVTYTSLLGKSTKAYRHLRNIIKAPIPDVSTLKAFVARFPVEEGLIDAALQILKIKAECWSDFEKITCLTFDEVSIKSNYEYDRVGDKILGPHKKTQVMFIRGLFSPWKNLIYFDHDKDVTKKNLFSVLERLQEVGFTVVSITCDMGAENRTLYTKLGVSKDKPWFLHPSTKSKIFAFHDAPHLLKLARNHLLDHKGMILDPSKDKNVKADIEAIKDLFNLGPLVELHPHRATWAHLEVRGSDRQRVRPASELLSNSLGSSLHEAGRKKLINSKNWEVNNIFNTKTSVI